MNLQMGKHVFQNVTIPLLWGKRAIIQDQGGRLSIMDVGGKAALLEVLGDAPASGMEFVPTADGFEILRNGTALYSYSPETKTVIGISLALPRCQIRDTDIRVGSNFFSGNIVVGFGVGIAVSESGVSMGAPLPPGLAELVV